MGTFNKVSQILEETKYCKVDSNGGPNIISHIVSFNSCTSNAPGVKTPNVNIIMGKNGVRHVFLNNEDTVNNAFMLKAYPAEDLLGHAFRLLTDRNHTASEVTYNGDNSVYRVQVTDSELMIEKNYQMNTQIFTLKYTDRQQFFTNLYATVMVLRTYPNIERMRIYMINYIDKEFTNCTCGYKVNPKEAMKIIVTHYYSYGESQYDPLPPHNITIPDILSECFSKLQ